MTKGVAHVYLVLVATCVCGTIGEITLYAGSPLVVTPGGRIRGLISLSRNEKSYYSFLGIRYGQTGGRFMLAEEPKPWEDEFDAVSFGAACAQINTLSRDLVSEGEDCLYLNIYLPAEPENRNSSLPVMFWVHGGSFMDGAGSEYGPDYFMDQDVVLITVNYRLGILGFLNTEDGSAPANNGLKDLILALKWIQKNIRSFGGDPGMVTLFGASSGAATVHVVALSPAAKGLFQRAILQSGTALCPWALTKSPATYVKKVAEHLQCPLENTGEILLCLRENSVRSLLSAQMHLAEKEFLLLGPSVESLSTVSGLDFASVPGTPYEIISKGDRNVSIMIGFAAREAIISAMSYYLSSWAAMSQLRDNWESVTAKIFFYKDYVPPNMLPQFSKQLHSIYFEGRDVSLETSDILVNMTTDVFYSRGARLASELHTLHGDLVFPYIFGYPGGYSLSKILGLKIKGPGHGDDLQYLFPSLRNPKLYPDLQKGSEEAEFSKKLVDVWVSFAAGREISSWDGNIWSELQLNKKEGVNYSIMFLNMMNVIAPLDDESYKRLLELDKLLSRYENPQTTWRMAPDLRDEL